MKSMKTTKMNTELDTTEFDADCLHCQLCKTIYEFGNSHGEMEFDMVMFAIGELLADIIAGENPTDRRDAIIAVTIAVTERLRTYDENDSGKLKKVTNDAPSSLN